MKVIDGLRVVVNKSLPRVLREHNMKILNEKAKTTAEFVPQSASVVVVSYWIQAVKGFDMGLNLAHIGCVLYCFWAASFSFPLFILLGAILCALTICDAYTHGSIVQGANGAISALRARDSRKLTDCDIDSLEIQTPRPEPARADHLSRLQKVLAKMKPDLVEVLNLHYKEGYTFAEIAKIRGKSLSAVCVELYRARNEVKKLIRIEEKQREEQEDQHSSDGQPANADTPEGRSRGGGSPGVEEAGGRA